ncbi:unnamed protein product [Durusdinium trenchii]|uniref:Secreted protein n=1 Tax=Durusdinium trenchii TaxID=1381693 RepID=A0ABP0L6C6_9DINO
MPTLLAGKLKSSGLAFIFGVVLLYPRPTLIGASLQVFLCWCCILAMNSWVSVGAWMKKKTCSLHFLVLESYEAANRPGMGGCDKRQQKRRVTVTAGPFRPWRRLRPHLRTGGGWFFAGAWQLGSPLRVLRTR